MADASEDFGVVELCATSYSTVCWVPGGIFIRRWCSIIEKDFRPLERREFYSYRRFRLDDGTKSLP